MQISTHREREREREREVMPARASRGYFPGEGDNLPRGEL